MSAPVVIAHLSDLHLDGGERAAARARRVVEHVRRLDPAPDVVLVTGDLADHGLPEEYVEVWELLASIAPVPVLVCPGNHDVREAFREHLVGEAPGAGPVNRVGEVAGVRFLMADSSIPGRDDGLLDDETIVWLRGELTSAPGTPAFICFHHPPVELHVPYVDGIRQQGEERLSAVIEEHPQVAAVLCGHAHTGAATTFAGRPLLVAPGVVSTTILPAEGDGIIDPDLPPALTLHVWAGGRLTSHVRALPML